MTPDQFMVGLDGKLMGQVNLVLTGHLMSMTAARSR